MKKRYLELAGPVGNDEIAAFCKDTDCSDSHVIERDRPRSYQALRSSGVSGQKELLGLCHRLRAISCLSAECELLGFYETPKYKPARGAFISDVNSFFAILGPRSVGGRPFARRPSAISGTNCANGAARHLARVAPH